MPADSIAIRVARRAIEPPWVLRDVPTDQDPRGIHGRRRIASEPARVMRAARRPARQVRPPAPAGKSGTTSPAALRSSRRSASVRMTTAARARAGDLGGSSSAGQNRRRRPAGGDPSARACAGPPRRSQGTWPRSTRRRERAGGGGAQPVVRQTRGRQGRRPLGLDVIERPAASQRARCASAFATSASTAAPVAKHLGCIADAHCDRAAVASCLRAP